MIVAQALAIAGGERRVESEAALSETIKLEAELNGFGSDSLRTTARLARLKSEFARSKEISFPPEMNGTDPTTAEIMEQERRIFQAHANEFERQQAGLTQLAELYNAEINVLDEKAQAIDNQIAQAQKQVEAITRLVNTGSATVSRLTDVERILADRRSQKLDNMLATMTARQNLSRAQRDLAKLQDEQQSDVAIQLQQEQAALEKLMLNQTATMRMLRQSIDFDENATLARTARTSLSYTILRQQDGQPVTLDANEATILLPGDLVKVTMQMTLPASGTAAAAAAAAADNVVLP
jgi:polysaccharide export outer membrane protein